MTRPRKQTVDYFPHCCSHKSTMYILEQRYGNDGYAFWFKLLELLGSTEGHYLDMNDEIAWEFLQAKTRLSPVGCEDILNLLSRVNAIDPELWSRRVIWSQNFIENVSDVYKNRKAQVPQKPSHLSFLLPEKEFLSVEKGLLPVGYEQLSREDDISGDNYPLPTRRYPQSKVKYSKEPPLPPLTGGGVSGDVSEKPKNQPNPESDLPEPLDSDSQPDPVKPKKTRGMTSKLLSLFEAFWAAYPNKKSRGQAETTWVKIAPDERLTDLIIKAIAQAQASDQWKKNGGQYIPHPSTWLNAKCWLDEQRPALPSPSEHALPSRRIISASVDKNLYADSSAGLSASRPGSVRHLLAPSMGKLP